RFEMRISCIDGLVTHRAMEHLDSGPQPPHCDPHLMHGLWSFLPVCGAGREVKDDVAQVPYDMCEGVANRNVRGKFRGTLMPWRGSGAGHDRDRFGCKTGARDTGTELTRNRYGQVPHRLRRAPQVDAAGVVLTGHRTHDTVDHGHADGARVCDQAVA